MIFIICTAMFVSIAIAFSCLMKKRIEEMLAPTAMFMILILYISGLFKNLLIGEYFIIVLSVIAIIFMFYIVIIKSDFDKIKQFATPGFLAFVIFMIFNIVICKGRWLSEGDEFTHWGRAILNMYRWNKFGNCVEPMNLFFPGYPPAVSLWGYFFVCLKSTFSEPYLFAAQNILVFVLLLPIYKKINWGHWKKALTLFIALLLVPLIFYSNFWSIIYVDGVLGIWMVYILYAHISEEENTPFKVLKIGLALAIYPLVKASGTGLAFLLILIIAVDILMFTKEKINWKKRIGVLSTYVVSVFIGNQSWSLYLKLTNTKTAWNTSTISIRHIIDFFYGRAEKYQYETVRNFINRFLQLGGWKDGKFTTMDWVLIIIFLSLLMYILKIWNRKQLLWYSGSFMLCIGIYATFLLTLYCFTFGEYEGPRLASYERYMGSILLGIVGFIIFMLVGESSGVSEKIMLAIMLSFMIPFSSVKMYTINMNIKKQEVLEKRLPYENMKEFADFMDWSKDKIYLIEQGSSGRGRSFGSYSSIPIICGPEWGWSLGPPLFDGDVWTVDYSLDEWENVLREGQYTYVYVSHQDEQFVKIYSDIFEDPDKIEDRTLYKVCEEKGKIVLQLYKKY